MFIKIGGIPASGKSTVTDLLIKKMNAIGIDADKVHGGKIMAEILGVDLATLRTLPEETRAKIRPEMYRRMYEDDARNPKRIIIRDAHFALYNLDEDCFEESPLQEGDQFQMKAMFVLSVSAEEIRRRRQQDYSIRCDRQLNIGLIQREIDTEVRVAKEQAKNLRVPFYLVANDRREPSLTCDEVVEIITDKVLVDPETELRKTIEKERLA